MSWEPLWSNGQSKDELRTALREAAAMMLNRHLTQIRTNEGATVSEIESLRAYVTQQRHAQIERELEQIMRDCAVTAICRPATRPFAAASP